MSFPIPCHRRIRPRRHNIAGEPSSQSAHLLSLSLPFTSNRTSLSHNSACLLPVILLFSLQRCRGAMCTSQLFFAAFCVLLCACTHPTRTRCTRATVAVGESRSRSSLFENSECEERGSGVCAWRGLLFLCSCGRPPIAICHCRHCTPLHCPAEARQARRAAKQAPAPAPTTLVPPSYHVPQCRSARRKTQASSIKHESMSSATAQQRKRTRAHKLQMGMDRYLRSDYALNTHQKPKAFGVLAAIERVPSYKRHSRCVLLGESCCCSLLRGADSFGP